jgi:hypothetical protein
MRGQEVILCVDATYNLTVKLGDTVRQGERLSRDLSPGTLSMAPTTGVVRSVQFDPERHEFVIVIAGAQ